MIIDRDKVEEVRKEIDKIKTRNKDETIEVRGKDIEFNRKILEMKKVDSLILSHSVGKDKLKQRDSGLNEVLCNIARKNNVTLAIDWNEFEVEDKKEKAVRLGRLIQNIKLIKKHENKIKMINNPEDKLSLQALFKVLGSDTKLASEVSNPSLLSKQKHQKSHLQI